MILKNSSPLHISITWPSALIYNLAFPVTVQHLESNLSLSLCEKNFSVFIFSTEVSWIWINSEVYLQNLWSFTGFLRFWKDKFTVLNAAKFKVWSTHHFYNICIKILEIFRIKNTCDINKIISVQPLCKTVTKISFFT